MLTNNSLGQNSITFTKCHLTCGIHDAQRIDIGNQMTTSLFFVCFDFSNFNTPKPYNYHLFVHIENVEPKKSKSKQVGVIYLLVDQNKVVIQFKFKGSLSNYAYYRVSKNKMKLTKQEVVRYLRPFAPTLL